MSKLLKILLWMYNVMIVIIVNVMMLFNDIWNPRRWTKIPMMKKNNSGNFGGEQDAETQT